MSQAGGRAQVFERDGFRFDAGPTVITAPFLFDELFELHGRRREDYVEFRPLDPWYRFQFSDGDIFDYGGEIEDTEAEISDLMRPTSKDTGDLSRTQRKSSMWVLLNFRIDHSIKSLPCWRRFRHCSS